MPTITTGGVAQNALEAAPDRKGFALQNLSAGDLWWSESATAVVGEPSFRLPAGAYYETPPGVHVLSKAVSIIGATTGQAFAVREW